jgi:hypothetical protein
MLSSVAVEAHASLVDEAVESFVNYVSVEVESVVGEVSHYIGKLSSRRAKVLLELASVGDTFERSLASSNYFPAILAFAAKFVDQVDAFEGMYSDMASGLGLPEFVITDHGRSVLSEKAAEAVTSIEGVSRRVGLTLQRYLGRSIGEPMTQAMANGAIDIVRKTREVGLVARDSIMSWFRTLCGLVYRNLEDSGTRLRYAYVGSFVKDSRDFCSNLMGKVLTLGEVDSLENGQVPGAMANGGGYGCVHFWSIVGRI